MMETEVRSEFDKVWAIIHASTVRANEIERRANEAHEKAMARMDRAIERMDRIEREHRLAHEKAIERMDKFERSLGGIRKLILMGAKEIQQMRAETRELKKAQKAYFDSLRNGGNGRKH